MNFYKRLEYVGSMIPQGTVVTYGQLALLCGFPCNSRQVGYALNRGLAGDFPAHRVVNSKGILSGAAAFDVPGLQQMLLESEAVEVNHGQVDLKRFQWRNSWEDALDLAKYFEERAI